MSEKIKCQGLKRMKVKNILKRNVKTLGVIGVIASWVTIGSVWSGFGTIAFVSYFVVGGLFGLVLIAERI
jgi:hypothetical protein